MERRWRILQDALASQGAADAFVEAFVDVLRARERRTRAARNRGASVRSDGRFFRWHDSGDLQSIAHLDLIVRIARRAPAVRFWLPTREVGIVKGWQALNGELPGNLVARLSIARVDDIGAPSLWSLLERPGIALSGVHSNAPGEAFEECGAYRREGACGDCRACWVQELTAISYPLH
jgi:hypothetical protein